MESAAVDLEERSKMHWLHLAAVWLSLNWVYAANTQFNLTLYRQMPPLYQLDDYDLCLQRAPSQLLAHSTYCLVYVELVANASSALWQQIDLVSRDAKHHYRHDRLFAGVCLERCKRQLHTLSRFQLQQLYAGRTEDHELSNYYARVHKRASDERLRYDHLINSCLNRELGGRYQLRVRSSIEYCERADEPLEHDPLDVFAYGLLGLLLLLTVCSSCYDFRLKRQQPQPAAARGNRFYQLPLKSPVQRLLSAFSLCRNYYRLVLPAGNDLGRDLRFFDAFRVIGVFVVILGHTLMLFMTVQVENPEFFELYLSRFETAFFQNGSAIIQIFFVMSAFLLYVNFTQRGWISSSSSIRSCIVAYFRVFFSRYFRLLPSLVLIIVANGSILSRLGDGPLWRHLTEAERIFCRENWWKNIFFINNYMLQESCAQQTWYMAADMQLFELFLIILIVTKKYPGLTRYINALLIVAIFAVPALLTYYLRLDAVYHLQPETYRYMYFRNASTFYETYPPFYTNLGGYFIGFVCAEIYLKYRSLPAGSSCRGKWTLELSLWLLVLAALLILCSGYIFIRFDFERPSIWLALYAGLYKNLWILACGGFVCCMCFKVGWIAYEFCSLPIFRPLARISFQSFLWHVFVMRIVAGYFRQPVYINSFFLFGNVVLVFVLTQIVAFFAALLFEYPLVELVKLLRIHEKPTGQQKPDKRPDNLNIFQIECNAR